MQNHTGRFRWSSFIAGLLVISAVLLPASPAFADHDPFLGVVQDKVTVCHATSSASNPWNSQEVSISSSGAPQGGHHNHNSDIIPPYHWMDGDGNIFSYPGKNWTPANQTLWNNGGCNGVAGTPTPSPSGTPTPSGTPIPTPTPDATITVIKMVVNDNGGTMVAGDFLMHVLDAGNFDVTGSPFAGSNAGTVVDVAAGNFTVTEDVYPDYVATVTGDCNADGTITVTAGNDYVCTITNDDIPGEIHGYKFEDTNGDGDWDMGELGIENWEINLYDAGMVFLASTSTDMNGHYMFGDLNVGTYNVRETQVMGWTQTTIDPTPIAIGLADVVENVNIGNFDNVSVSGAKLNQNNVNQVGWTFFIDENGNAILDMGEVSVVSTDTGYIFEDLGPGTYSVCEVIQSGWQPQSGSFCQDVVVNVSGQDITGVNYVNIQDQEGTQGFWRNAVKTGKYSVPTIDAWLAQIDASSHWLMPTGYTATNASLVKLIDDATKQCNKNAGSMQCATLKFSTQYLVTQLDVLSGRKDLDTWYAVTPGAQTLLGLSAMEQLSDIISATEALSGPLTREQYLTLAGLFDSINNTGY